MPDTKKPAATSKRPAGRATPAKGWTAEEKAAMKEHARELKAAAQGAGAEAEVLAKIREMPKADREIAERIHALVKEHAPSLTARTWYGMPAYARDGKVVCFYQAAAKFKARYGTLGFNDAATLDDGAMWPTSYAVAKLTPETERTIAKLVRQAAG